MTTASPLRPDAAQAASGTRGRGPMNGFAGESTRAFWIRRNTISSSFASLKSKGISEWKTSLPAEKTWIW